MIDMAAFVLAVGTGVVVVVVAIAVVLVVLFVTLSMRGRQRRAAEWRGEARDATDQAAERAERQRDRDSVRHDREDSAPEQ